ncbi:amylopullulanase, partial [bacterium]|nr:amylopullulanase [bacterium]
MSDPAGADITIDGIATGDVTPMDYLRPVGRLTVAAALNGHMTIPESRELGISAGRRVDAYFELAELGELTVTSTPSGGAILIDGEDAGETTP